MRCAISLAMASGQAPLKYPQKQDEDGLGPLFSPEGAIYAQVTAHPRITVGRLLAQLTAATQTQIQILHCKAKGSLGGGIIERKLRS